MVGVNERKNLNYFQIRSLFSGQFQRDEGQEERKGVSAKYAYCSLFPLSSHSSFSASTSYSLSSHLPLNPLLNPLTLLKSFFNSSKPRKLRSLRFSLFCIFPSMGVKLSKNSSDGTPAPSIEPETNTQMNDNDNLSSYVQACELDPDVQVFDSHLHERTFHVISSLAGGGDEGFEVRSLSLDSLRQVAGCLIDMNQEVVKVILECKKDVWNNQDLFALVQDYFEYSIHTLDFFTALDKCLKRARERQLIIQVALVQFEEEIRNNGRMNGDGGGMNGRCGKVLQELRNFKEAGDPFTEEFFSIFQSVYKQQVQMFEKLKLRKQKLDKKLRQVKAYRKVSNMIFAAAFIAVIICSVVAAAISAPPVVSALAAAASAPMGGIGKWMNSLWKKYESELKTQRELISSMEVGTYITIKDLDSIRVLVDKLEIHIESVLENAEFALTEEGAMTVVIEEIKKKQTEFTEAIDELGQHGNKYSRDIRRARTVILQRIIKHPTEE